MNGPEHYREAERLLADVDRLHGAGNIERLARTGNVDATAAALDAMGNLIAAAQVHATLALAAATAATQATAYDGDEQHHRSRGWAGVA